MVIYQEEVVVQTRWVATERVRLAVQSVTEHREISEELRRERIELRQDAPRAHPRSQPG